MEESMESHFYVMSKLPDLMLSNNRYSIFSVSVTLTVSLSLSFAGWLIDALLFWLNFCLGLFYQGRFLRICLSCPSYAYFSLSVYICLTHFRNSMPFSPCFLSMAVSLTGSERQKREGQSQEDGQNKIQTEKY